MTPLTRRRVLLGGAALAALAAHPVRTALAAPGGVTTQLAELERRHAAHIGVYARNLASGRTIAHRSGEPFAMCSTFKTYAAARVLQLVDRGEANLEETMFVDPAAILINSPVTAERAGGVMTLSELCQAALQRSDNAAANLLLHRIGGPPAITAFARGIGDDRTRLDRWEPELNAAVPGDPRDTSTPEALAGGYRALLDGEVLSPLRRGLLDAWMRANQTSSMRAGFPPGWTSADKTGSGDYASTNDVGIAYGPAGERLLLAFMARSARDNPDAEGLRPLIGELAALIVPALTA
jgi:beta-lactamase class A